MRLVLFAETLLAIWLGVNWGVGTADSPGGKVVLSIIAVIVLDLTFALITALVMLPFNRTPNYGRLPYRSYRPTTTASREASRSEGIEYFRRLREQDAPGSSVPPSKEPVRTESFSDRLGKTRPLPPSAE